MTAPASIDVSGWLHEQLDQASPDLLRAMVSTFVQALMGAEADAVCGADYGQRSGDRVHTRNGYRHRDFDTYAHTSFSKLVRETDLIGPLQKPGSKHRMNLDRGVDNSAAHVVDIHNTELTCRRHASVMGFRSTSAALCGSAVKPGVP